MITFNRWLKANAAGTSPPMRLVDTSATSRKETSDAVLRWVLRHLAATAEGRR